MVLSSEEEMEASRSLSCCEAEASRRFNSAATRVWMWSSRSEARVLSVCQSKEH